MRFFQSVALAQNPDSPRTTVLDFNVPLDRMIRVLRRRFASELGEEQGEPDVLLRYKDSWLQLALSLEAQGVSRDAAAGETLLVYTAATVSRMICDWPASQSASFDAQV